MFENRTHAGELLAKKLKMSSRNWDNGLILAIPKGGLEIAAPISAELKLNVEVLISQKIGHSLNPQVAVGAIMPDGSLIHDNQYVTGIGLTQENFDSMAAKAKKTWSDKLKTYGEIVVKNHEIKDKNIIIVDDGIATGYTMEASIKWLQKWQPKSICVAVPVASSDAISRIEESIDELFIVDERDVLTAVGSYYKDFSEMTDDEALAFHRLAPNGIVRV